MVVQGLLGKAAGTVVTGLVGVSAYEVLRKALAKAPIHDAAVTATEWGLRGTRRAEEAAESARLKLADVVAEARERVIPNGVFGFAGMAAINHTFRYALAVHFVPLNPGPALGEAPGKHILGNNR